MGLDPIVTSSGEPSTGAQRVGRAEERTRMFGRRPLDSHTTDAESSRPPPVRILTTDAELHDAIERASAFEQRVFKRASARTRRYDDLASACREALSDRGPIHPPDAP